MGWNNPPSSWREYEAALSGHHHVTPTTETVVGAGAGDDDQKWSSLNAEARAQPARNDTPRSQKREPYEPPAELRTAPSGPTVPYAELHAHSNFSFLDGASHPEELLEEAVRLGLHGLALTDHDGFYGVARMAEAAESHPQLTTVFGAELSLGLTKPQNGAADPEGSHVLVLARRHEGYHRLSAAITEAALAGGEKGKPRYDLERLADHAGGPAGGHWLVLTGCRKGTVRQALHRGGTAAAATELDRLVALFGRDSVAVELTSHGDPLDDARNDALAELAATQGLAVVATGNVHYATPERYRLAGALAAVRARRSLDDLDGWLPASGAAHLRSGAEMAARFARYPGAIERTVEYADDLGFRLRSLRPGLPKQRVPEGHTPMSWLRHLVWSAVPAKYPDLTEQNRARIESELAVIEQKDFPGYFLIVHDIVREARSRGILCQGRGSAANSAVCYLLNVTAVDSIFYNLPFERFLSSMRDEEPDIDVDFDSDRREEIIQYVYETYGRNKAAQVANVISYRPRNAVRDMAKALGHSPGQQDAWSKQIERYSLADGADTDIPTPVMELARQVLKFPRHLGIHSGGMVLTDRPVGEVVPIEHGRMDGRTVVQWDKDDCAWMGLVKFDLLGLGILAALQYCFDLVRDHLGEEWELSTIPKEEAGVYDMLCRADAIGVFQVESRAQMGLLPRLRPREFYDLVVEIAMIRPGPIQGGAVHPYVRRRMDKEKVTYAHPKLREPLERTLGIPVFQEQLMQMAVAVGNCTGEDADLLRRAMGSKRGIERIEKLRKKLYAGMAENGLTGEVADDIYRKIQAFANFGFAESHALSFALLVYASSWLKLHYPGAFLASLLRAQPMGFYSPATLIADARRHGVEVRRPDVQTSRADAGLEPLDPRQSPNSCWLSSPRSGRIETPPANNACLNRVQAKIDPFDPTAPFSTDDHRRDAGLAVRLGLASVRGISGLEAERIVAEREQRGPYRDMADLARRAKLTTPQLEALAAAGAFACFGLSTREALWAAGSAAQNRPEYLEGTTVTVQPPLFTLPTEAERLVADMWATGVSTDDHPIRHARELLTARGVLSADDLVTAEAGRRIEVGGLVIHRQRPSTASGITFMNLEDETGLINVVCSPGLWKRYRRIARESRALVVRGTLERSPEGVINVVADRVEPLPVVASTRSRDFQ